MRTKEETRVAHRAVLKRRRARLKKNSLCQDCGQNPPFPKKTLCITCLNARIASNSARRSRLKLVPKPTVATHAQAPLQSLRLVGSSPVYLHGHGEFTAPPPQLSLAEMARINREKIRKLVDRWLGVVMARLARS